MLSLLVSMLPTYLGMQQATRPFGDAVNGRLASARIPAGSIVFLHLLSSAPYHLLASSYLTGITSTKLRIGATTANALGSTSLTRAALILGPGVAIPWVIVLHRAGAMGYWPLWYLALGPGAYCILALYISRSLGSLSSDIKDLAGSMYDAKTL